MLVFVIFDAPNSHAAFNIVEKVKNAVEKFKDKAENVILKYKKHRNHNEDVKDSPVKHKRRTKVMSFEVHIPPPDVEIFKQDPIDVTIRRPNTYTEFPFYVVSNVWIYEKTGVSSGHSMDLAFRNAIDMAFSNLIMDQNLDHLYFDISDAIYCLDEMYVEQERFIENEYMGDFTAYFSIEKFEKIINIKRYAFLAQGLDEYQKPLTEISVIAEVLNKAHWLELEKRLIESGVDYSINGISAQTAIITLKGQGENIVEKLGKHNLKIKLADKKYYLRLSEQMMQNG